MEPLRSESIYTERPVKVICIGAGASGLLLAYKLNRHCRNFELTVSSNCRCGHFSGLNINVSRSTKRMMVCREPGSRTNIQGKFLGYLLNVMSNKNWSCACDVPAHNYTYSFEPKHDWSSVYASSTEIKGYFTEFCNKHALDRHIRLSHCVKNAAWIETDGEWEVEVLDINSKHTIRDRCQILIHACGYLNKPAFPNIPGRQSFKGAVVHTGHWDKSVELGGKSVALVGSGYVEQPSCGA